MINFMFLDFKLTVDACARIQAGFEVALAKCVRQHTFLHIAYRVCYAPAGEVCDIPA